MGRTENVQRAYVPAGAQDAQCPDLTERTKGLVHDEQAVKSL